MKTLLIFLAVAIVISAFVVYIPLGVERSTKIECNKLQTWKQQGYNIQPNASTTAMCSEIGIQI